LDPRVSGAGRSRPLTDASPGPERSSGRRVRTRRHSFRGRPRTRTHALFRTESQSFLGARAIEKTQRLAFLGEAGIPERKLPDEGRGGYRAARRDRGARADGGMRRPVTRLAPCPERRLDPSLYAVAERAALSAHTPWETQSSDPAAGSGGHQRRRNRGFQLSLSCSSSSSSSGRHSVVIALLTRAPDRSDLRGEGFTYGQIAIHG
jgi:hypothetical protein